MSEYIPNSGDIVWVAIDPTLGHEQKGRRPCLVVTNSEFNSKTGLSWVCPITNVDKKYIFHISFKGKKVKGYVMSDQMRSIDWNVRKVEFVEKIEKETLEDVRAIIEAIITG